MLSKKKIIRNLILVLGILIILIILLCSLGDIKAIWNTISTRCDLLWLLATFGITFLYAIINQMSMVFLTKRKYKDISFFTLFFISGSEYFFNAITPFSSGGQPFLAYALKRKNVKLSDSTSILLLNFLAYQIVMNIISIFGVIFYYHKLVTEVPNFGILVGVGFSINFVIMIILILLGTTKFMGKAIVGLLDLLCKIKFLKKLLGSKRESFIIYVSEMQAAFKEMTLAPGAWFKALLTKMIAHILYYAIPFFSFLALRINLGYENFMYVFFVTSFALTIAVWVPTPGASGGAELAFTTLFISLAALNSAPYNPEGTVETAKTLAMSGMLIWRFFTYYYLILHGFINYIIFEKTDKDKDKIAPEEIHIDSIESEDKLVIEEC